MCLWTFCCTHRWWTVLQWIVNDLVFERFVAHIGGTMDCERASVWTFCCTHRWWTVLQWIVNDLVCWWTLCNTQLVCLWMSCNIQVIHTQVRTKVQHCLRQQTQLPFFEKPCHFVTARPALELLSFWNKSSFATIRHFCSSIVDGRAPPIYLLLSNKNVHVMDHTYIHLSRHSQIWNYIP